MSPPSLYHKTPVLPVLQRWALCTTAQGWRRRKDGTYSEAWTTSTSSPPSTYPSSWCTSSSLLESRSSTGLPPSSPGPWPAGCRTVPGSARWLPSPHSTSWEGLWWNSAQERLKSIRVTEHTQGPRGGGERRQVNQIQQIKRLYFLCPISKEILKCTMHLNQHLVLHKEQRRHTLKSISTLPDSVCTSYDYIFTKN